MTADGLEVRQSSASVWGSSTELRNLKVVSKYIDTSLHRLQGMRSGLPGVNDLHVLPTQQVGTYQTMPSLDANSVDPDPGDGREGDLLVAHAPKDGCMHCGDPGCLKACPRPVRSCSNQNGICGRESEACIGCKMCETGCPFDVPRYSATTDKMAKCTCASTACRSPGDGLRQVVPHRLPALRRQTDMVALGNARVGSTRRAALPRRRSTDPPGVGGTTVIHGLAHGDHPEWSACRRIPTCREPCGCCKNVLRPLGASRVAAPFVSGIGGHYLLFGPKESE